MKSQPFFKHDWRNWRLVLICLVVLAILCMSGAAYAREPAFRLQSVRGTVEIQSGGKGNWASLQRGVREASTGDHIRTGANGSVHIVTDDGARIALGPKTEVILREPDRPNCWRVAVGRVMAFITRTHRLEVRTPGAIAAVEGTTFQIDVAEDGTSVLTVVEGVVRFANELGSVTVLDSQQSTARVGEAPSRPIVVDPSSLTAWEADLKTLTTSLEYPLVGLDRAKLEQELARREQPVSEHPDDASARAALAEVLIDLHRTEEAVSHAQKAIELAANEKRYRGVLAYASLQAGRPEDAQIQFADAVLAEPNDARWRIGEALVALGQRDAETAVKVIESATKLVPGNAYLWAYLAAADMRVGNLQAAKTSIAEAVKIDPDNYVANSNLAYIHLAESKTDDAIADARKAVRIAPQSAQAHEALGTVLTFAGQFAEATQELDKAIEINPLSSGSRLARAKLLAAGGDMETALQEAQLAVGLNPDSAPARSTLGLLFLLNNDPERAGRQFREALTADPSLADARTGWGLVLLKRGRFRDAVEQQKLAVSLDTDSASARNNLGGVYASTGQMGLAREHLNHAIQLQPGWGMPYANMALVYLEENRFRDALEAGERAVTLGERSAFAHTVLARIYRRQGRTDRAFSELRQAVALDDRYPQAHFQLAQLYLERNRSRDAVREILNSVAADPSAMLETRSYARTENMLAGGSNGRVRDDARHSSQTADGRLSYFVSTLFDSDDGFRPVNQDASEKFAEVIVGYQPRPTQQLVFFSTLFDRQGGLPGVETDTSLGDPDDEQHFRGGDGILAFRQKLSPKVTGTLKYSLRQSRFAFNNPDGLTPEDDNPFLEMSSRSTQQSQEIRLEAILDQRSALSLGYARLSDSIRQTGIVRTSDPDPSPFAISGIDTADTAWVEVTKSPSDRLDLTLGGYWGQENGTSGVLLPKVAVLYRPDRSAWWSFAMTPIMRADSSELAPVEALADPKGLSYLDFDAGGFGRSYELRYQRKGGRSSTFTTSLAYQQVEGLLLNVEDPSLTGLPTRVLIDRGHRWVADLAYERWLSDNVTGRVWARWQSSLGRFPEAFTSGNEWPYTPNLQTGARLDYINARGWRIGLEAEAVGRRFHDPENSTQVAGYLLFNLRLQYQRNLRQNYFLNVMNLTDSNYETFAGFPQSGMAIVGGIEKRY